MSGSFRARSRQEIAERQPATTTRPVMRKLARDTDARRAAAGPDAIARATAARSDAVEHLAEYHDQVRERFAGRGIGYHRAATAEEALATVLGLLGPARRVAKSKSMVAEEIGLTHALRERGIDVLETDIGEYIVDLEGRGPSHITAPAIHLNRSHIRAILEREGTEFPDDDPGRLSRHIRDIVGRYFEDCDAAITGANAIVASSGRIAIVENEGNVSLGASHPAMHIVVTGIEKVVRDETAALDMLSVLAASATAQPLTAFTHFLADPSPEGQERHVVFVDNGRSRVAEDERYRDVLRCIRCGACMNNCPVYRAAGGIAYGSPYMGPIGAVLSPLLWEDGRYADLPFASSLCGACTEVCPVGIPLHRMLLDLRADAVESGAAGSRAERAAWRGWRETFRRGGLARMAQRLGGAGLEAMRRLPGAPGRLPAREGAHDVTPPAARAGEIPVEPPVAEIPVPADLPALFRARAEDLGVSVVDRVESRDGDVLLQAAAGVANTGSVLLLGAEVDHRRILGAQRVVVRVETGSLVRYPVELDSRLGEVTALLLTGGSRTADIEKELVRGIHGAEEMVYVLEG